MRYKTMASAFLLLAGCASVDPGPAWQEVGVLSKSRVDAEPVWVRSDEDATRVRRLVTAMLKDGLTRDEAVRIAVLNSPDLQARFADLGIAAAALVEASLLSNPSIDVWWALPGSAGGSALGLFGWLSDLWIVPKRKAIAQVTALQTQHAVVLDIMATARRAAGGWDRLVVAREELRHATALLASRRAHAKRRALRFSHGLDEDAIVSEANAMVAEQEVAERETEQALTEAATGLDRILAVENVARHVREAAALSPYPTGDPSLQTVLERGFSQRLDLAIARLEVERAERVLDLEGALTWSSVSFGVNKEGRFTKIYDSNPAVDEAIGPVLSLEVPVFNQNQAGKAAGAYALQRAVKGLEIARLQAVKDLTDRFEMLRRAKQNLSSLETVVLKGAEAQLAYATEWNRKMQLPFIDVLVAEERLIMVRMEIARAKEKQNDSWRLLQMAVKGG